MQITNLLFRLDAQRLRNIVQHYRTENQKRLRIIVAVAALGLFLWFNVFRHVAAKHEWFDDHWNVVRYAFPVLFAFSTSIFGAYGRVSRWLGRWSSRSWSVLPVEPRPIAQWLLGSMLLWDSVDIVLGTIVSIGLAYILKLNWLREFPFLLLGTALLVVVISVSKTLTTLLLRYGGGRILLWPNWAVKWLSSLLAMAVLQPLAAFWWIAEFSRQRGNPGIALIALFILAAGTAVLAWCTYALIVRYWSDIAASFEFQQTHQKAKGRVPLASFLANRMRSPVTRIVTLYNLRSRNQQVGWSGSKITIGGRRLHMLVAFFLGVSLLIFVGIAASFEEKSPVGMVLFSGGWASLFATMMLMPIFPAYRLLRMLPVSFFQWLWAVAALPLTVTGFFLTIIAVFLVVLDPTTAFQGIVAMLGIFLGIVPIRIFVQSAYPNAMMQTSDMIYMALLAIGVLLYFAISWIAVVPWILGANIYFVRRAARVWRWREEGLHA